MTYVAPPFVWGVFAISVIYMASVGYLMRYLKNAHHETWTSLGSPSLILNNSIRNGFLSLRFLFGSKYRTLNDPKLTKLIWGTRALFFLCLALILTGKWLGYR
jgi:hypothetical protein